MSLLVGDMRDRVWISRFTADGALDGAFAGGRAEVDLGDFHQFASLSVFQDGSVLGTAIASVDGTSRSSRSFAFKLTPRGALDVDFADGGVYRLAEDEVASVGVELPGSDVLLAGKASAGVGVVPALWRLDAQGEPVAAFGGAGRVTITLPAKRSGSIRALIPVDDARLLAVGEPGITAMMVSGLDGTLDPSFGEGGLSITAFEDPIAAVSAVLLPDGRFAVLADEDSLQLGLARFFL